MLQRIDIGLLNKALSAVLLGVAIATAVSLVAAGQSGGFDVVVFVSVGALATAAALSSLELGLMALIFVAATDGFLKGFSPGWHTQLLKDYIIAICLLRWAWLSALGHRRQSLQHPLSLPILIFAGWVFVQLLNARSGSIPVGLAGLRMWTIWLPVFFLAYDSIQARVQMNRLLLFILILFIPISVYGIAQYYVGLEHLFRMGPGFDVLHYEYYTGSAGNEWRPPSTTVSPHALAGSLATVVLMAVGAAIYFKSNRALQAAIIVAIPIMASALMITAVRNAVASAVIGVLALLIVIRRIDLAVIAILLGGIAFTQVDLITSGEANRRLVSIGTNIDESIGRVVYPFGRAASFALEHPLGSGIASGWGTGRLTRLGVDDLAPEKRSIAVENEYGRSLSELGIPGFVFFMWLLFSINRTIVRSYRSATQPRDRWLLAGIFAGCFSIFGRLLTGPALYGWPEAPIFWMLVAMAARVPEIERDEEMRAQAPRPESRAIVLGHATLPWVAAARDQVEVRE